MLPLLPFLWIILIFTNILSSNTINIVNLYFFDFLLSLIIAFAIGILLVITTHFFIKMITKKNLKKEHNSTILTALISSVLITYLLISGELFQFFDNTVNLLIAKITIKDVDNFLFLSLTVIALFCSGLTFLPNKEQKALSKGLTIYVLIVITLNVFNISKNLITQTNNQRISSAMQANEQAVSPSTDPIDLNSSTDNQAIERKTLLAQPDVYFILLDSYPNEAPLKTLFSMDNSKFLNKLRDRDFLVISDSFSNYNSTTLSLASSLNMEYLDWVDKEPVDFSHRTTLFLDKIHHSKVFNTFKTEGYTTYMFKAGTHITGGVDADVGIECGSINEYTFLILQKSIIGVFMKELNVNRGKRLLCTFEKVPEIAKINQKKFVFVHIMSPHRPFLFDENDNPVNDPVNLIGGDLERVRDEGYVLYEDKALVKKYLGQIAFLNHHVVDMINEIITNNKASGRGEPIIILQSDHADRFSLSYGKPYEPTDMMLYENAYILNTFYAPQPIKDDLYEGISPVNTYKVIFHHLFGHPLNLEKDKHMFSPYEFIEAEQRFQFKDLTKRVVSARKKYVKENNDKEASGEQWKEFKY